jgi:hypothetical protein
MKNLLWWLIPVALTLGALYWFYQYQHRSAPEAPQLPAAVVVPAAPPAPPAETHYPVPAPPTGAEAAPPEIPSLAESDTALRAALVSVFGQGAFDLLFYPKEIVRRIVATVDNLPREKVSQNVLPTKKVPGRFLVATNGDTTVIDPANAARYKPYVDAFDAIDVHQSVALYTRFYPLFQEAYKDLGYPKTYFNDRLIAVIDDLLAAPEPKDPPQLAEPHLMYQFADPSLEALPAGQKALIRMGPGNEARVKAKLRAIRAELAKGAVTVQP